MSATASMDGGRRRLDRGFRCPSHGERDEHRGLPLENALRANLLGSAHASRWPWFDGSVHSLRYTTLTCRYARSSDPPELPSGFWNSTSAVDRTPHGVCRMRFHARRARNRPGQLSIRHLGPPAVVWRDGTTQTCPPETPSHQMTTELSTRHPKGASVDSFRQLTTGRNIDHTRRNRQLKPILKQRLGSRLAEPEGVCTNHFQGAQVP